MNRTSLLSRMLFFCALGLALLAPACNNPPTVMPMDQVTTPVIVRATGGTLQFNYYESKPQRQISLNQPSSTEYYILAKLVQPGVASLDLVLTSQIPFEQFQAMLSPQDLASFQVGAAQIEITSTDGMTTLSVMLQ